MGKCVLKPQEIQWGKEALAELRRRTKDDPFFAVGTAILHGGKFDYNRQQPVLEAMTELPDAEKLKLSFPIFMNDFLAVNKSQTYDKRVEPSAEAVKIWIDQCCPPEQVEEIGEGFKPKDPNLQCNLCVTPDDFDALSTRLMEEFKGVGLKTKNLVDEYFGDDEAVAVDRHICKFLVEEHEMRPFKKPHRKTHYDEQDSVQICRGNDPRKTKTSRSMTEKEFTQMKEKFQEVAEDCDELPADYQVAVWLKQACLSRLARMPKKPHKAVLPLTKDFVKACVDYMPGQQKLF